jgi:hypothetical protein
MSAVNLQLPDSIHRGACVLAEQAGISLDQFIASAVAEKISVLTTESYLEGMAKRGSRARYEAVLAKVPDVQPESNDYWAQE